MIRCCWYVAIALFFLSASWAQEDEKQKITFEWLYKQNVDEHPEIDLDMPYHFKWSKEGHLLSYLVSRATEPPHLVIYDPAKDATAFVAAPSVLLQASNALRSSTAEAALAHTPKINPQIESATGMPEIKRTEWIESDSTLNLHVDDRVYRWNWKENLFSRETKEEKVKLPDGEKRELSYSENERYAAYVRNNDLWVYDTQQKREWQLTKDGGETVLNGIYSWVYWEELHHRSRYRAFEWSPSNHAIAYLQTNESAVSTYPVTNYEKPVPETRQMAYPKAGSKNPIVRLGVVPLATQHTIWIDLGEPFEYIVNFAWSPEGKILAVEAMNRDQNRLALFFADPMTGQCKKVLEESSDTWVQSYGGPRFLEKSDDFLWISDRTGFKHLYRYSKDGKQIKQLSHGKWGIRTNTGGLWLDEEETRVVFPSNYPSAVNKQYYSISLRNGRIERITQADGTHSLSISADGRFAVDTFRSVNTPKQVQVIDRRGNKIRDMGKTTMNDYQSLNLQTTELVEIEGPDGNLFYASIMKPAEFDPKQKYPALVNVYGGPAGQIVRNSFSEHGAYTSTAFANEGFVYVKFDPRGTPNRGREWENACYQNFGGTPVDDLQIIVDYLKTVPYVDTERLGIWGWSHGGYMSCCAMTMKPGLFQAGAAVAPVTDWRLYDTIYTERYMDHPDENEEGYHDASPVNFAENMEGALFIGHGIADDNVHIQNVYRMVDELIKAKKDYTLYVYPNKAHGIGGDDRRYHLFSRMVEFFQKHLE